jgi:hypothetical protein
MPLRAIPGSGRAGAWNAVHTRAAESAQADLVPSQLRFATARDGAGPPRSGSISHARGMVTLARALTLPGADTPVPVTPHTPGPPSPRRRTSHRRSRGFNRPGRGRSRALSRPNEYCVPYFCAFLVFSVQKHVLPHRIRSLCYTERYNVAILSHVVRSITCGRKMCEALRFCRSATSRSVHQGAAGQSDSGRISHDRSGEKGCGGPAVWPARR